MHAKPMNSEDQNQAPSEQAHNSKGAEPSTGAGNAQSSGWQGRKTVLSRTFLGAPSSTIFRRGWDTNWYRLDSRALLAILQAEAFREKSRSRESVSSSSKKEESVGENQPGSDKGG